MATAPQRRRRAEMVVPAYNAYHMLERRARRGGTGRREGCEGGGEGGDGLRRERRGEARGVLGDRSRDTAAGVLVWSGSPRNGGERNPWRGRWNPVYLSSGAAAGAGAHVDVDGAAVVAARYLLFTAQRPTAHSPQSTTRRPPPRCLFQGDHRTTTHGACGLSSRAQRSDRAQRRPAGSNYQLPTRVARRADRASASAFGPRSRTAGTGLPLPPTAHRPQHRPRAGHGAPTNRRSSESFSSSRSQGTTKIYGNAAAVPARL